ncbi:MAG: fibronectin type III domain-containing protein [Syntrophorhabdales bacterium]|jgi:hypothetical protein
MRHVQSKSIRPGFARLFAGTISLFLLFFLSVPVLLFTGANAHAEVTLGWTASASSTVAGYKLYYGTASGNYTYNVNVGNTTSYALSGLSAGATYYFAAAAYDSAGDQSAYSNELSYTVPSACTYSISPTSGSFAASGGTGSVSVTTKTGCAWTAASAASWMTITSGGSGTGSGTVRYSLAANTTTSSLTAASTIAGRAFTVTEAGVPAYTITASAGTGGAISPSGSVSVKRGSSQGFSITPASGHTVSGLTVDRVSVGPVRSYTFSDVMVNHTIAATFSGCTYSISHTSGSFAASGGTGSVGVTTQSGCAWTAVSAASWMTITSGGSGTGSGTVRYSLAANTTTSSLTAVSTIAGHAFTVTEAGVPAYTITASAGTGGAISPSGSVSVERGSNQAFSITPASGYTVDGVTVDGVSVGRVSLYMFNDVMANHTIAATFSR